MIEVRKLIKRFGLKSVLRIGPRRLASSSLCWDRMVPGRPPSCASCPRSRFHLRRGGLPAASLPAQACGAPPPGVVSPLLYGDLTAEENLRFYACMYSIPDVDRRIGEVLDLVGLAPAGATWCAPFRACSSAWRSAAPCCMTLK